jgi:hypothetical protein
MVNNFRRAEAAFNTACNNSMNLVGMYGLGQMRLETPVDTGRLKGSLEYNVNKQGKSWVLTWGTNVKYALPVHEGTRYMAPRRFMLNPVIRNIGNIRQIFLTEFRRNFA